MERDRASPGARASGGSTGADPYDVVGADIATLRAALDAGRVTASSLVASYRARIAALDAEGPTLRAVIAVNPEAAAEAAASDRRRAAGAAPRPLEGIPILVKDNIETAGPLPTTAGSLALLGNVAGRDAPVVARLRAAGAVILGKTNLSEWANFRARDSISGWSAVGGLTRNPYATARSACGSSSGSGAAVAASFAPAALGTETDGSIICPASMAGLVGFKPSVGLASRGRIVPISATQDTPGPMARTVADAALLLAAIADADPDDPATASPAAAAARAALASIGGGGVVAGARLGVARFLAGRSAAADRLFADTLARLRDAGAVLVELPDGPDAGAVGRAESTVLLCEFRQGLDAYLAAAPAAVAVRSLADLLAFNRAHADRELALFGQDLAERSVATGGTDDPAYEAARDAASRLAGAEGLEPLFAAHGLDAIVAPSTAPAYVIDAVNGDPDIAAATTLPAVLGWPHLTLPMGVVRGLPVGLSVIGLRWTDARVLALGAAIAPLLPVVPLPAFGAGADGPDTPGDLLGPPDATEGGHASS